MPLSRHQRAKTHLAYDWPVDGPPVPTTSSINKLAFKRRLEKVPLLPVPLQPSGGPIDKKWQSQHNDR